MVCELIRRGRRVKLNKDKPIVTRAYGELEWGNRLAKLRRYCWYWAGKTRAREGLAMLTSRTCFGMNLVGIMATLSAAVLRPYEEMKMAACAYAVLAVPRERCAAGVAGAGLASAGAHADGVEESNGIRPSTNVG